MSDYAGVIGNVVTIVGAATGQVWLQAAGMALSAWGASQQVLPGPKIGDVQRQTSQEGGFRPIVYGRSHPIAGNIIADGGPVIVTRRERQGKGGPKVESESAYRTYAVGVCEGEATLLQAWRNGILVYDAEDGSMAAENAAFLEYATWYTGSFDQPASPDLEEVYGAGQAPYFRGTAYLSIHNEDVTDQRGAWSQWQFRVFRGAASSYTTPLYPIFSQEKFSSGLAHYEPSMNSIVTRASGSGGDFGASLAVTNISLREPQVTIEPSEQFISSLSVTMVRLSEPIVEADAAQDSNIEAGLAVDGVGIRAARIQANPDNETNIETTIAITGVTLS